MKVTFEVPDALWFRLASIADDRGCKVGDLFAEQVRVLVWATDHPNVEPVDALNAELTQRRRERYRATSRASWSEERAWLEGQIRRANHATFQVRDEDAATAEVDALKAHRKAGAA